MATNLYNYYKEKGQNMPSVAERSSLANQYGIQNYSGTAQQNAQLLQSLQNQPFIGPVQGNTVTVGGTPDVTQLPSEYNNGVPTYNAPLSAPIVPFNQSVPQQVPEAPQLSFKENLNADIARITAEKQAIEDELNGIGDARNTELTNTGVYDKLKLLDKLNGELRQAKNNESIIPLQAKQDLRKTGPTTKADFASYTSPQLEKNAISALTASTQSGYITDQINTQLAITNQKFDEKKEAAKFKFEQTSKYLGTLQTAYADILTSEQSTALEGRKQQNAIELKNLDFNNDMLKTAYTEAIKSGANPADIQAAIDSGDLFKLYALSGNTSKGMTDTQISASVATINSIDGMLANTKGLSGSVGSTWLGRSIFGAKTNPFSDPFNFGIGDSNTFRTDAKALVSAETISYFTKIKSEGANLGAMSDGEWDMLANASETRYLSIDRETGKSTLPEDVFKKRLTAYQSAAKKAVLADSFSKSGKDPKTINNLLPETINELYKQATTPPTEDYDSELSMNKGTSNNLPQRNNNPGNLKGGGLETVQSLATGKDSQGHLIFPTPEAGFQALALDLKAKISGNSRYLPPNPTIAQLGKIYAEDGNWGNKVAGILGVPTSTATSSVQFKKLIYAVSKQEGFFA